MEKRFSKNIFWAGNTESVPNELGSKVSPREQTIKEANGKRTGTGAKKMLKKKKSVHSNEKL